MRDKKRWKSVLAVLGLVAPGIAMLPDGIPVLTGVLGIYFCVLLFAHRTIWLSTLSIFGVTTITLGRIFLPVAAAWCMTAWSSWTLGIVFGMAAALDAADGHLARQWSSTSDLGAFLDEEADALFVFMAGLVLWRGGWMDFWIVLPGGLRYAVAAVVSGRDGAVVAHGPHRVSRWIAGGIFTLMPFLFVIPLELRDWVGMLILAALVYSLGAELRSYVKS